MVSACREGSSSNSIAENGKNIYTIYPNPSDGNVTVSQSVVADETVTVKVVNSIGQTVYSNAMNFAGGTSQLNLSGNTSGVYLLVFTDNKGRMQTFRMVIEK